MAAMHRDHDPTDRLDLHGWSLVPGVVDAAACDELLACLPAVARAEAGGPRAGVRHLLDVGVVRELARSGAPRRAAEAALGAGCFAVRALLFDKTHDANWKVVWHQDRTVALAERPADGIEGTFTKKDGVWHALVGAEVMNHMIAIRLHLDECREENGALRVIPGSHRRGVLAPGEIEQWCAAGGEQVIAARRGEMLQMRPLLLHASGRATDPRHRRVLHFEYAACELPPGLRWRDTIA
jgi:hypothetical protein